MFIQVSYLENDVNFLHRFYCVHPLQRRLSRRIHAPSSKVDSSPDDCFPSPFCFSLYLVCGGGLSGFEEVDATARPEMMMMDPRAPQRRH